MEKTFADKYCFRKPNALVHSRLLNAKENRTQRLAWNTMLMLAQRARQDDEHYTVSNSWFRKVIGYSSTNYGHLNQLLSALQDIKAEWNMIDMDRQGPFMTSNLLSHFSVNGKEFQFALPPEVKSLLFSKCLYVPINLEILQRLTRNSSISLYEWCYRYRRNPRKLTCRLRYEEWAGIIYSPNIDITSVRVKVVVA